MSYAGHMHIIHVCHMPGTCTSHVTYNAKYTHKTWKSLAFISHVQTIMIYRELLAICTQTCFLMSCILYFWVSCPAVPFIRSDLGLKFSFIIILMFLMYTHKVDVRWFTGIFYKCRIYMLYLQQIMIIMIAN